MSKLKNQAKKLSQISKKYGYNIKHTHALEIISQLEGDSNRHVKLIKETDSSDLLDDQFQRGLLKMFLEDKDILRAAIVADETMKTTKICLSKKRYSIFLVVKKLVKDQNFSIEELKKILASSKKNEKLFLELDEVLKLDVITYKHYKEFFYSLSQQCVLKNFLPK